jgi:hypothetical protein
MSNWQCNLIAFSAKLLGPSRWKQKSLPKHQFPNSAFHGVRNQSTTVSASWFEPFLKCYSSDQIKEMGSICSTHEADKKLVIMIVSRHNFDVCAKIFGSWAQNIFLITFTSLRLKVGSTELSLRSGIIPEKLTAVLLVRGNSQNFMQPEGSLPFLQEPTTGPYPEPNEFSSQTRTNFFVVCRLITLNRMIGE